MPDKIKILVTGFDGKGLNPNMSADVVRRLKVTHPNVEVMTLVLDPCSYQKSRAKLQGAIAEFKPDFVLSMGEDDLKYEAGMRFETTAHSQSSQPDEEYNYWPGKDSVSENLQIDNYIPLLATRTGQLFKQHFPRSTDMKFGTDKSRYYYLCNDTYYTALRAQEAAGKKGQALFLHINDVTIMPPRARIYTNEKRCARDEAKRKEAFKGKREEALQGYADIVADLISYIGDLPDKYMMLATNETKHFPTAEELAAAEKKAKEPLFKFDGAPAKQAAVICYPCAPVSEVQAPPPSLPNRKIGPVIWRNQ